MGSGFAAFPVGSGIEDGERHDVERAALVRGRRRRRDDAGASEASVKQTAGGMGGMEPTADSWGERAKNRVLWAQ